MIVPLPAVQPSGELGVVLQGATFGALIGSGIAARRRRHDPSADAWLLTTRWSLVGALAGLAWVVVSRVT